jgi:hypothetical protein
MDLLIYIQENSNKEYLENITQQCISIEITKNQHYFAYLMKTRFSEFDFNKLIKNELLLTAVSFFRNFLVKDILKQNLFQTLGDDISNSIKINNKRKYS